MPRPTADAAVPVSVSPDTAAAAEAVCLLLEEEVGGRSGNGWFDDDPKMRAHFFSDEDEG